jgi:outer membrane protein assembly factor BamB
VVEGTQAFFGLGNGRLNASAELPERSAGQLLCADADTGAVLWAYSVPDAVLGRATLDADHVYFGARDGRCYCLTRRQGTLCWSRELGSPIVTQPALVDGRLYVIASGGSVTCLEARDGSPIWHFDVAAHSQTAPRLLSSPVVVSLPEGRRRIYFGTELNNSVTSAAVLYCLEDGGKIR